MRKAASKVMLEGAYDDISMSGWVPSISVQRWVDEVYADGRRVLVARIARLEHKMELLLEALRLEYVLGEGPRLVKKAKEGKK